MDTEREARQQPSSAEMTDRQLAAMARYGRKVVFLCPELQDDVSGYVIGFDDVNVRIAKVVSDTRGSRIIVVLRNRDYIAGMDPDNGATIKDEPVAAELENMIAPFRRFVMSKYFPQHSSS